MFRPLQGHHQEARKLHSLHIQCFCLLSHLVQFHCHIYIYYSYLQCLCLKYVKYTEYKILKMFVNFRSKMVKWNHVVYLLCLPSLVSFSVLALVFYIYIYIWMVSLVNISCETKGRNQNRSYILCCIYEVYANFVSNHIWLEWHTCLCCVCTDWLSCVCIWVAVSSQAHAY
jgi:hypothetical protein